MRCLALARNQLIALAMLQSTPFFRRRLCSQLALDRVVSLLRLRRPLLHLAALAVPQSAPFSRRHLPRQHAQGQVLAHRRLRLRLPHLLAQAVL